LLDQEWRLNVSEAMLVLLLLVVVGKINSIVLLLRLIMVL